MTLDQWPIVFVALVLVTLLGIPARMLVGSLALLLRVPANFARAEFEPPLRRATPTAPYRLLRNLRDYFRPVLDRPGRALTGAAGGLFFTAPHAGDRPGPPLTLLNVGVFRPLGLQAPTAAANARHLLGH